MFKPLFKTALTISILLCINHAFAKDVYETVDEQIEDGKNIQEGKKKGQVIAVPIPIANPTIGTGLQGAVLYLHPKKADKTIPNATTGLVSMYTDTESWATGVFHDNYLFDDKFRLRLAYGTGRFNIDYYGTGSKPIFEDNPLNYQLEFDIALIQTLGRIPFSENWFGGVRLVGMDTKVAFDLSSIIPDVPYLEADSHLANIAILLRYDDRDNNYYPTTGRKAGLTSAHDDESWNSDYNYDRHTIDYAQYISITERDVFALRAYASKVDGNAPFFLLPSLNMRGFASNRYQDDAAVSVHSEWRRKVTPRFGFIMSLEAGKVDDSLSDAFHGGDIVSSIGAGIRWQVTAEQPMNLGLDVGFSQDDYAIYVQIGEKF